MERRRVQDRLVGAALAVLVLVLAVVVLLWSITDPAGDGPRAEPSAAADRGQPGAPPAEPAEGEVWLSDLVLDAGTVALPDSTLKDVRAVGADVRTGRSGLVAGSLTVEATVPFDVVARELGDGVVVRAQSASQATVVRTSEIAGRELRVVATGTVEVADGIVVVEPRTIDVGGPELLSNVLGALARRLVTIEHRIEGLPEGLVLQDVTVQDDGFRASLEGEDVVVVP
jgi:hypothetical protein